MIRLNGLIPPICTPLREDGVDARSLARLIEHQLATGVDGIFVLGSSGEAVYLNDRERARVVDVARVTVSNAVPLLVGALEATATRVSQQMRRLEPNGGITAWVVTAPFYAACSITEVAEHFRAVAKGTERPVLAYDIPGNVGRPLDRRVVLELLQSQALAGLKDSSGSLDGLEALVEQLGADRPVSLLTGVDAKAAAALTMGADGLVPGLANIRPGYFLQLINACRDGDRARAVVFQEAIAQLAGVFRIGERYGVGRHASELGALKTVLVDEGIISTPAVSVPMSPLPQNARDDVRQLVQAVDRRLDVALSSASTVDDRKESRD